MSDESAGGADEAPGSRDSGIADGLRLAATTFTVAPVQAGRIDRSAARVAIAVAPGVGLLLGAAIGLLAIALRACHTPALVTGLLCVAALAGVTRGLHLDGLADTVDALGSYCSRERALEIMKSPEVGPFGVVALLLALAIPAACIAALTGLTWWRLLFALAAAAGTGRLAVVLGCRRGVPPARPDGLGAFLSGVAGPGMIAAGTAAVLITALFAVPGRPWQGALAVLAGIAAALGLLWHTGRRFGGMTGDILGACCEVSTAVTLVGLVMGG